MGRGEREGAGREYSDHEAQLPAKSSRAIGYRRTKAPPRTNPEKIGRVGRNLSCCLRQATSLVCKEERVGARLQYLPADRQSQSLSTHLARIEGFANLGHERAIVDVSGLGGGLLCRLAEAPVDVRRHRYVYSPLSLTGNVPVRVRVLTQ